MPAVYDASGGLGSMAEAERVRATAGVLAWIVRLVLVVATFLLLGYASQLLAEAQIKMSANFRSYPWDVSAALAIVVLAGVMFAMAARFPFPRPRFVWGRLLVALLILVPAIHTTLIYSGLIPGPTWWFPRWLFRSWWWDTTAIAEVSAALSGVAIGCGFGARRAAPS
jgi:hypothetical protein